MASSTALKLRHASHSHHGSPRLASRLQAMQADTPLCSLPAPGLLDTMLHLNAPPTHSDTRT